ncbi:TlpA family protein disulfide reductase [Pyxidicoccus sp. MSG2]|uniref:TlpA family protein disulfide reductase n=1 Tax=Pyxidicoccus sp. MSG2 TaxID=2996790 RepID=UPI002271B148|nr:TlpA disulfide reductase family protein [Pyxidicoccus sp. MSG2]MCY1024029.1 TlpA disulfide reductase family protein [Pyxidicoccus sp. MSG2]
MRLHRSWRALALCLLVTLCGCRTEPPPSYIRVEGAASVLADVPVSPALLVVFWASWCPPCREETPQLLELAQAPPDGLRVVVFSHDASLEAVGAFFGGPPAPALHLRLDPGEAIGQAFGVDQLPTSILVVDGRLVARFQGPREWNSRGMRRLLEKLMREPVPRAPAPAR